MSRYFISRGIVGFLLAPLATAQDPRIVLEPNTILETSRVPTTIGNFTLVAPVTWENPDFDIVDGDDDDDNEDFRIVGSSLRLREDLNFDFDVPHEPLTIRIRVTAPQGVWEEAIVITVIDDRTEDTDGDGLTEAEEEDLHGTSDLTADSDGDGVIDPVEVAMQTSPIDGAIWPDYPMLGWGSSGAGELVVPFDNTLSRLSTGGTHGAAARFDGTLALWGGRNKFGQVTAPAGLGTVVSIVAGGDSWPDDTGHTVALLATGEVAAWGCNFLGQATVPPGLVGVVDVAAGRDHSLALREDGTVVAWGGNNRDQAKVPADLDGVIAIAAGGSSSFALREDGTVRAWGSFFDGTEWQPAWVPAGLRDVVGISAGYHHALALRRDGSLVAWGRNTHGQAEIPAGTGEVTAIAAGGFHNLAITSAGGVIAWGLNASGQASVPISAGQEMVAIGAGAFHSLALRRFAGMPEIVSAKTAIAGPGDLFGFQIEVANATPSHFRALGLPSGFDLDPVTGLLTGSTVSALRQSVRILVDTDKGRLEQTLWLGVINGTPPTAISLSSGVFVENSPPGTPVGDFTVADPDPDDVHALELVAGEGAALNRYFEIEDGSLVVGTGTALDHEGYTGNSTIRVRATDSQMNSFETILTLEFIDDRSEDADGDGFTEAEEEDVYGTDDFKVDSDGDGYGDAFEIERESNPSSATSVPSGYVLIAWGATADSRTKIPTGLTDAVSVSSGMGHNLALREGGTVAAWGLNADGQAVVPPDLDSVIAVAAGGFHSLALREDGSIVAWGRNDEGQASVPEGLGQVVAIAAGKLHSLALKQDGSVISWGGGEVGQAAVHPNLGRVVAISAGEDFSVALREDSTVVTWGSGPAGAGSFVSGLNQQIIGIAAGAHHGLALRADGTVTGWGDNTHGQIHVPQGLKNIVAIAAGERHGAALDATGKVVVWGDAPGLALPPPEAIQIDRLSSGANHLLAIRGKNLLPAISEASKVEASTATVVSKAVMVSGATPSHFTAIGLPEDLSLNSTTGAITGTITSGLVRSVRLMVESNRRPVDRVLLFNTRDGVPPTAVSLVTTGVMENSLPGIPVGTLSATDADPLDAHTFTLVDGDGSRNNEHFAIEGDRLVVGSEPMRTFESFVQPLWIRIRATDIAGKFHEAKFPIELFDDWSEDEDGNGYSQAEEVYQVWAAGQSLEGDDALPNRMPHGDGIKNLVRYALPVGQTELAGAIEDRVIYEAEQATYVGPSRLSQYQGYSGTGYIDFNNGSGDFLEWTVVAPATGMHQVTLRYAFGPSSIPLRPMALSVNGLLVDPNLQFPLTSSWSTWEGLNLTLALNAGLNKVRLTSIGFSGANFDRLELSLDNLISPLFEGGGRIGLPVAEFKPVGDQQQVRFSYLRRRSVGLVVIPQRSDIPELDSWEPMGGTMTETAVHPDWDLVVVEELLSPLPRRFFSLRIELP